MNLTTAVRLNWLGGFVSPIFFVSFILIGFSPEIFTASLAVGLFYQFFLHTEAVGRLGFFERWLLNTPSAHRVHHGSNEKYIDKIYGEMLVKDNDISKYRKIKSINKSRNREMKKLLSKEQFEVYSKNKKKCKRK